MTIKQLSEHDEIAVQARFQSALGLIECASCAADYVAISPGSPGIVATLLAASNAISEIQEMLGLEESEDDAADEKAVRS